MEVYYLNSLTKFHFDAQQCGQHVKEIDYGGWPAPRNHMSMKQGYEVNIFKLCMKVFPILFNTFSCLQAKMNDHHPNNLQKGEYAWD